MSPIYTRGGDDGSTALADGSRTAKDSARLEAYGAVDETNSWIGAVLGFTRDPYLTPRLLHVQDLLFVIGAELAGADRSGGGRAVGAEDSVRLERWIDALMAQCPPLKLFVLPGGPGSPAAALLHVARTVCRRAERRVVLLARTEAVPQTVRIYLNRLGDFLFAAARYQHHKDGAQETIWSLSKSAVLGPDGRPLPPPE